MGKTGKTEMNPTLNILMVVMCRVTATVAFGTACMYAGSAFTLLAIRRDTGHQYGEPDMLLNAALMHFIAACGLTAWGWMFRSTPDK
jgi:hypothetical protein